jgi:hypothetical protein
MTRIFECYDGLTLEYGEFTEDDRKIEYLKTIEEIRFLL